LPYFSPKELLIGIAAIVWIALLGWFFAFSDKTIDDLLINVISEPVLKVLESLESVVILCAAAESMIGGCDVDQGSAHSACAA
jgi:hypothetical protein